MKRFSAFFFAFVTLVISLSSCNEVNQIDVNEPTHSIILRAASPEADPITKTVLEGVTPKWCVGDQIAVSDGASNIAFTSTLEETSAVSEFSNESATLSGDYYAYYPYQNNGLASGDNAGKAKIDIAAIQNPTVASFDGAADILVSKMFTATSETKVVDLQFTRATSVVKVILLDNDAQLSGEIVKSVTIESSSNDLTGRAYLDLALAQFTSLYYNNQKKVTANYTSSTGYVVNGTNGTYLCVYPTTLPSGSTLKINAVTSTKTISKEITLSSDIIFAAGKVTTLKIGLAESNVTITPVGHSLPIIDNFKWNTATSDQSSDLTSKVSTILDDNSIAYVASCSKYYAGANHTAKLGTSSVAGSFKTINLDLSSDFTIKISTKKYNTDAGTVDVYVDDDKVASITPSSTAQDTVIECTAATNMSTIEVKTSEKRAYICAFSVVEKGYVPPVVEVEAPTFSVAAGTYTEAKNVEISCATEGATIYFSTDGTNFSEYTSAISVSASTTLYAYAQKGDVKSDTVSVAYVIDTVPVYASLSDLVAAGDPSSSGNMVTVTLTNEEITDFYYASGGKYCNGVYVMVGEQEVELYCKNVPETWVIGGKISGTITCIWKKYNETWELCPTDWTGFTYTAPASAVTVSSIAITTPPTKTTYTAGEYFSPSGMVVTATYSDESTAEVTGYTYYPNGALATTDTQITVTYEGKTATQAITVNASTSTSIKATWTATSGGLGSSGTPVTTIKDDKGNQWNVTITGATYLGWSSNHIQVGSKNNPTSLTLSTSDIAGTVKSISVVGWSYNGLHTYSYTVGGNSFASGSTPSSSAEMKGTGSATGTVEITFSTGSGSRALYIKSIEVVYE